MQRGEEERDETSAVVLDGAPQEEERSGQQETADVRAMRDDASAQLDQRFRQLEARLIGVIEATMTSVTSAIHQRSTAVNAVDPDVVRGERVIIGNSPASMLAMANANGEGDAHNDGTDVRVAGDEYLEGFEAGRDLTSDAPTHYSAHGSAYGMQYRMTPMSEAATMRRERHQDGTAHRGPPRVRRGDPQETKEDRPPLTAAALKVWSAATSALEGTQIPALKAEPTYEEIGIYLAESATWFRKVVPTYLKNMNVTMYSHRDARAMRIGSIPDTKVIELLVKNIKNVHLARFLNERSIDGIDDFVKQIQKRFSMNPFTDLLTFAEIPAYEMLKTGTLQDAGRLRDQLDSRYDVACARAVQWREGVLRLQGVTWDEIRNSKEAERLISRFEQAMIFVLFWASLPPKVRQLITKQDEYLPIHAEGKGCLQLKKDLPGLICSNALLLESCERTSKKKGNTSATQQGSGGATPAAPATMGKGDAGGERKQQATSSTPKTGARPQHICAFCGNLGHVVANCRIKASTGAQVTKCVTCGGEHQTAAHPKLMDFIDRNPTNGFARFMASKLPEALKKKVTWMRAEPQLRQLVIECGSIRNWDCDQAFGYAECVSGIQDARNPAIVRAAVVGERAGNVVPLVIFAALNDTGATVNIISHQVAEELEGHLEFQTTDGVVARCANSQVIALPRKIDNCPLQVAWRGEEYRVDVTVYVAERTDFRMGCFLGEPFHRAVEQFVTWRKKAVPKDQWLIGKPLHRNPLVCRCEEVCQKEVQRELDFQGRGMGLKGVRHAPTPRTPRK